MAWHTRNITILLASCKTTDTIPIRVHLFITSGILMAWHTTNTMSLLAKCKKNPDTFVSPSRSESIFSLPLVPTWHSTRQTQCLYWQNVKNPDTFVSPLESECTFSLPLIPTWHTTNIMSLLANLKKPGQFRITISINGCTIFICCKTLRHESVSVKLIYLDATVSLICSRAIVIARILAVNMDEKSGDLL